MKLIAWEVKCNCGNIINGRGLSKSGKECQDCGKKFDVMIYIYDTGTTGHIEHNA